MDSSHKLDAPNNEELRTIEQIEDRSELGTLYREPGDQYDGTILSPEARDKAKAEKLEALTSGISRSSFKIGFLLPYPFISGLLLAFGIYTTTSWINTGVLIALLIVAGGFWVLTSYFAYAAIYKIFYKHALRTGPYLFVMLLSVLAASQAIYGIVTEQFSTQSALFNIALVSLFVILYSVIATFVLLLVWGSAHVNAVFKVIVAASIVIVSVLFLASTYLL